MLLGYSTGFLPPAAKLKQALAYCRQIGGKAVELCCQADSIAAFNDLKPSDLVGFEVVSFHLPEEIFRQDNRKLAGKLNMIKTVYDKLKLSHLIVHPDVIKDWRLFDQYNFRILVENMDRNKKTGKTVKELAAIINNNDFGLSLDLNHCFANDRSMKLADEFINKMIDKIGEIHLSGYQDRRRLHYPLFKTKQLAILDRVPDKNIPVIIESICLDLSEAKQEYFFIANYLSQRYAPNR